MGETSSAAARPLVVAAARPFVITGPVAAAIALGGLVLLLACAHRLISVAQKDHPSSGDPGKPPPGVGSPEDTMARRRRRGVKALVIGTDGRASTSKAAVVLWTFAVFYAFAFLIVWGRSRGCPISSPAPLCVQAAHARGSFAVIARRVLQPEYLVLLGFPVAAAVTAKALTTDKLAEGTLTKTPSAGKAGVGQALREIVTNDAGDADLLDFQYFAFNLLTLAFFVIEFSTHPGNGLPTLPPTLIALSGLSAATYTTKKALESDTAPVITAVIPRRIPLTAGQQVVVVGTGFGSRPEPPLPAHQPGARVMLDTAELQVLRWSDRHITAALTQETIDEHPHAPGEASKSGVLVVSDAGGLPSAEFAVEFAPPRSGSVIHPAVLAPSRPPARKPGPGPAGTPAAPATVPGPAGSGPERTP